MLNQENQVEPMTTENITDTLTPKLLIVSVPEEAIRNSPQTTPTHASAPQTANPSPATLFPFQNLSFITTPSPPASPSPQGQNTNSPFMLGPHQSPPSTQPTGTGMQVDDQENAAALGAEHPPPPPPTQVQPINQDAQVQEENTVTPLQAIMDEEEEEQNTPMGNGTGPLESYDPLDRFTNAEMPQVYDAYPNAAFEYINREVLGVWERYPGSKLIAIPFDNEVKDHTKHKGIRTRIFAAAANITRSQTIAVAAPTPNEKARKNHATPKTFLIYKMDESQRETLLKRRVWSCTDITFRVAPLTPSRPNFLFAITGLSTGACEDVHEMVKNVWRDEHSVAMYQTILDSRSTGEKPSTQTALETFVSAMYVQRIDTKAKGGILCPKFNVYTETKDIHNGATWSKLRNYLAKRTYATTMLGQCSVVIAPHTCTICHSVDHPKGFCPFPNVPNWNGPTGGNGAGHAN